MDDLIARLGKATGQDRELDCLIDQAAFPDKQVMIDQGEIASAKPGRERFGRPVVQGPLSDFPMLGWTDWEHIGRHIDAPHYTGSLDAARLLILPEHSFGGLAQVSPRDWIMLIFSRTDSKARWEGEAATAELAVCIAALKARLSAHQQNEKSYG